MPFNRTLPGLSKVPRQMSDDDSGSLTDTVPLPLLYGVRGGKVTFPAEMRKWVSRWKAPEGRNHVAQGVNPGRGRRRGGPGARTGARRRGVAPAPARTRGLGGARGGRRGGGRRRGAQGPPPGLRDPAPPGREGGAIAP